MSKDLESKKNAQQEAKKVQEASKKSVPISKVNRTHGSRL